MHMLTKKDLNSDEVQTVYKYPKALQEVPQPTCVAETDEEAVVHINDLDLFVTVQLFEDTPPVLSF